MPTITDKVDVEVTVTPHQLGRIFARMDSKEQAIFFEGVATEINEWVNPACFQWHMMREDMASYPRALTAFKDMAEYAVDSDI